MQGELISIVWTSIIFQVINFVVYGMAMFLIFYFLKKLQKEVRKESEDQKQLEILFEIIMFKLQFIINK